MSEASWFGLMVNKTLPYNDTEAVSREMTVIFNVDIIGHKIVCCDQMESSGEYYVFVYCKDYWSHAGDVSRNHYVTDVIPSKDNPYRFKEREVMEFVDSVECVRGNKFQLMKGDVVLIKDGYLKGLYGVIAEAKSENKYKVFFSFYVKQIFEYFDVTEMDLVDSASGFQVNPEVLEKPIVLGAHVVHNRKLHREKCR